MARRPGHPRKRRFLLRVVAGVITFALAAFLILYFVIFPTSSPKPFKLSGSTVSRSTSSTSSSSAADSSASSASSSSSSSLTGSWKIASGSEAGYRVREKLGFLPAESDAVGRTAQISGSASFTESAAKLTIHSASFDVAVDTLKSDRSMRDERIHQIGIESSRYPSATFTLSSPVTISTSAIKRKVARAEVIGTFNIHGTAKKETLPVEMSLSGSTFEAVGALTFPWSEFGMSAPSVGGFVNVTGKATMEFDLHMQRV